LLFILIARPESIFIHFVILDSFIRSGQAAIAAIRTQRHYVGYDINEEYVKLAERRIKEFITDFNSPKLFDFRQKKAK
jgi:hypothetical protein